MENCRANSGPTIPKSFNTSVASKKTNTMVKEKSSRMITFSKANLLKEIFSSENFSGNKMTRLISIQASSTKILRCMGKVVSCLTVGVLEETCGTYRGEFKNNKKEGDGSFKYLNGNVFRGYYISGRKKGFGELFSPFNEIIYRGEWANDVP